MAERTDDGPGQENGPRSESRPPPQGSIWLAVVAALLGCLSAGAHLVTLAAGDRLHTVVVADSIAVPTSTAALGFAIVALVEAARGRMSRLGTVLAALGLVGGLGILLAIMWLLLVPLGTAAGIAWVATVVARSRKPRASAAPAARAAEGSEAVAGRPELSTLALASLALGFLSFFTLGIASFPGIVVAIGALVQIRTSRGRLWGTGFAIAGLLLSLGPLVAMVLSGR